MLRGLTGDPTPQIRPTPETTEEFPGVDQPYKLEEHSSGICFYVAKGSFFRPYHLLQSMHYQPECLTLNFAADDVIIGGRGLHPLYRELARHRVGQIIEQGERYAEMAESGICVNKITVIAQGGGA